MSSRWKADGCREEALSHMIPQNVKKILCWPGWCFVGRQGPCPTVISSILCSSTALHTASVATDVFFVSVRNGAISEYGYNLFVCSIVNLQTALPLL